MLKIAGYIVGIILIIILALFSYCACVISSRHSEEETEEELNTHLQLTKLIRENEEQEKIILEQEKEIKRLNDKGQDKLIEELLSKRDRAINLISLYRMDNDTSIETHKALDKILECLIDKE
jgi:hypothetical protein